MRPELGELLHLRRRWRQIHPLAVPLEDAFWQCAPCSAALAGKSGRSEGTPVFDCVCPQQQGPCLHLQQLQTYSICDAVEVCYSLP